jgi:hypothetical protein
MRIVYLCPVDASPSGGIKVIYKHSEILNSLGVDSAVFHPFEPGFRCDWFEHSTKFLSTGSFDKNTDIIVIPEVWAGVFGRQCMAAGLKYCILVQAGHYLYSEKKESMGRTRQDVKQVYEYAKFVLSISDYATALISLAFPEVKSRILRVLPHIDDEYLQTGLPATREKLIAYMPRRLEEHANIAKQFLEPCLPNGWSIMAIEKASTKEVAKTLRKSSIFLSFSDREGFGLPPLEAALCGNLVCGYSGQGGKEYFLRPIFTEVTNGDFLGLVRACLIDTENITQGITDSMSYLNTLEILKGNYSRNNESRYLKKFANNCITILKA